MKITLIGSGNMANAFATQLAKAGHNVSVTSPDASAADALAQAHGAKVVPADCAADADLLILATRAGDAIPALRDLGDLTDKIVVDITNPVTDDLTSLTIGHTSSSAEEIACALPDIRLVKGFNTVFAQLLSAGAALPDGGKVMVFLASDDAEAKTTVGELARSMGFAVIDAGPLKNARYLEPLAGLNIYLGYRAGHGTAISPAWVSAD